MPLAGGRGVLGEVNWEMDSLNQRVRIDYNVDRVEQLTYSVFDLASARSAVCLSRVSWTNYSFFMSAMPVLMTPVLVSRISFKLLRMFHSVSTEDFMFRTAIYEQKPDLSLQLVEESVVNTPVSATTSVVYPTWYHTNLSDNQKFRLEPGTKYFNAVVLNQANTGLNFYVAGSYNATNGVLSSSSIDSIKKIINYSEVESTSAIGFPNIVYSSQEAKDIFKWQ